MGRGTAIILRARDGTALPLTVWAARFGMPYEAMYWRFRRLAPGQTAVEALLDSLERRRNAEAKGLRRPTRRP